MTGRKRTGREAAESQERPIPEHDASLQSVCIPFLFAVYTAELCGESILETELSGFMMLKQSIELTALWTSFLGTPVLNDVLPYVITSVLRCLS